MSKRDERLAAKYAAKGMKSATETSREKNGRRSESKQPPQTRSGGIEDELRNFDSGRPKETAVPRSAESVGRAKAHKFRLPRLG